MNIHSIYGLISPRFRIKRLRWFRERLKVGADVQILDVGGQPWCWNDTEMPNYITLLNLRYPGGTDQTQPRFRFVVGDGCALPFANLEFDVLFSNSVIEHVGTWERQLQFSAEARRTGRKLWIQTPAREFFVEPHLVAPFIHFLPVSLQRRLIRNFTVWGWVARPTAAQVDAFLAEVRLLRREEMRELFPDCDILEEKFLGMTKSYIAVRDC